LRTELSEVLEKGLLRPPEEPEFETKTIFRSFFGLD
jgi:hypothetical protein